LPSTEHCAERGEQPNIARCSHSFGTNDQEPIRFGCSVRHRDHVCCSARDSARDCDYSRIIRELFGLKLRKSASKMISAELHLRERHQETNLKL
jgi:hypothetical protein